MKSAAPKFSHCDKKGTETELIILQIHDPDSDPTDYLFQDAAYAEQDQARYDSWLKNEWCFCGIRVQITVHNWQTGTVAIYVSAGLWGIEDDSAEAYLREVAEEELLSLQADYPQFKEFKIDSKTPIQVDY